MTETATEPMAPATPPSDDHTDRDLSDQNFGLAVAAGLGAAVLGAILWALFVYVTNMEIGLVAIAVGALVGYSVQKAGRGSDPKFGLLGATCAALGWAL